MTRCKLGSQGLSGLQEEAGLAEAPGPQECPLPGVFFWKERGVVASQIFCKLKKMRKLEINRVGIEKLGAMAECIDVLLSTKEWKPNCSPVPHCVHRGKETPAHHGAGKGRASSSRSVYAPQMPFLGLGHLSVHALNPTLAQHSFHAMTTKTVYGKRKQRKGFS